MTSLVTPLRSPLTGSIGILIGDISGVFLGFLPSSVYTTSPLRTEGVALAAAIGLLLSFKVTVAFCYIRDGVRSTLISTVAYLESVSERLVFMMMLSFAWMFILDVLIAPS